MSKKIQTIIVLVFYGFLTGCIAGHTSTLPTDPAGRLAETVKSTQGLTLLFIVSAAIAMMALFNGSKSAAGWIIASLFGLGLSIAVARYAEIIGLMCLIGSTVWFGRSLLKRKGWLFNWTIRKGKK